MSAPESLRLWIDRAEDDLLNIRNNLAAASVPWGTVCFHAQQAAEKYLKALLLAYGVRPPRSHDLGFLLAMCLEHAAALYTLGEDCARLRAYAIDSRYPDVPFTIDEAEGRAAAAAADRVRAAVRPVLGAVLGE